MNPRIPRLIVSIDSNDSATDSSLTLSQKQPNAPIFEMNKSVAQFHPPNTRFLTVGPNFSSQTAIFAPFFQEAWKNKPDVEASSRSAGIDFSAAPDVVAMSHTGTSVPYQNVMFGSKTSHRQHSREFSAPVLSTFSNKDTDDKEIEQEQQHYSVCSYLASPVKNKKLTSQQSTTEPFICYTKIRAENPLTVETQNLETCFAAASSSRQLRSLVSPLSRPSPRPYS